MSANNSAQPQVLIVGGGLVGLSTGLFLHHHRIPFTLLEKEASHSILPRSRGLHVRVAELFRQVDVEDDVNAAAKAAWLQGGFGGARRGTSMLKSEALDTGGMRPQMGQDPSPCSFGACPQTLLEPLLRRKLEERGGDVRFGHEVVGFQDSGDEVVVDVRDSTGHQLQMTAQYVVACDGGRSFFRHVLGIGSSTTPAATHYVNLYFEADLAEQVKGRTFSQCNVVNDRVRGLFLAMNNTTKWSFHLIYDPDTFNPDTTTEAEYVDLIHHAIGDHNLPIKLLAPPGKWSDTTRVADRYRAGRICLAGDALHVWPPWGGFGGTSGITDANNLAWKLAACLRSEASDALLDTYEAERRPVALMCAEQALARSDFEARFRVETATNGDDIRRQLDMNAVLLRQRYAIDGQSTEPVEQLKAQTGTRFPHAWVQHEGRRQSTLDLFGSTYVLVVGPQGGAKWGAGVSGYQPLVVHTLGEDVRLEESEGGKDRVDWTKLTELQEDGAVLVRPDGIVAARSDGQLQPK